MFTRCPRCKAVHTLDAAKLSQARGAAECGHCGQSFDALDCLFDQWPSGQAHAPRPGPHASLPVLGKGTEQIPAVTDKGEGTVVTSGSRRLAWGLLAVILLTLTMVNAAWTFRGPLAQLPVIGDWLENLSGLQQERPGLLSDPGQIRLVSRDMHSHPTRSGILVLSLTFVNLAEQTQEFPMLEVTLLDVSNQPVAQRRFQPSEYLREGVDTRNGLAVDVYLPVLLELGDVGARATGFELRFL